MRVLGVLTFGAAGHREEDAEHKDQAPISESNALVRSHRYVAYLPSYAPKDQRLFALLRGCLRTVLKCMLSFVRKLGRKTQVHQGRKTQVERVLQRLLALAQLF